MSLLSRFSPSNPENMEKRYYKEQAQAVERVFGIGVNELRQMFPMDGYNLKDVGSSDPQDKYLDKLGVNAVVHTEELSIEQFPLLVNILKSGREETTFRHFVRKAPGLNAHTILATEDRFSGKTVRLITNDVELLKTISAARFSPPPPWVAWYELGAVGAAARQGDAEFWYGYVWDRFWNKLSLEEQALYLENWREKTEAYISNEDWSDWVSFVRRRDPKYREREDD
ncbi:hypothetical protein MAFF241648_21440 [Ralstonia solanacearum]|nr:hypothetical protein MAFF241648_21440 [Ralstonia solanacearum]